MNKCALALVLISFGAMAVPALGQQPRMLVVTISDIGRPYTPTGGDCKFASLVQKLLGGQPKDNYETAVGTAVNNLVDSAKKESADAIVGLQITPVVTSVVNASGGLGSNLSGILACGTLVKFK